MNFSIKLASLMTYYKLISYMSESFWAAGVTTALS